MKKSLLLIIFFIITIVILSVVQVSAANKLSTTGIELDDLQSQIAKYQKENTILAEKVLEASSLINISKRAKELGFVPAQSQIYLVNPPPLALNQ